MLPRRLLTSFSWPCSSWRSRKSTMALGTIRSKRTDTGRRNQCSGTRCMGGQALHLACPSFSIHSSSDPGSSLQLAAASSRESRRGETLRRLHGPPAPPAAFPAFTACPDRRGAPACCPPRPTPVCTPWRPLGRTSRVPDGPCSSGSSVAPCERRCNGPGQLLPCRRCRRACAAAPRCRASRPTTRLAAAPAAAGIATSCKRG